MAALDEHRRRQGQSAQKKRAPSKKKAAAKAYGSRSPKPSRGTHAVPPNLPMSSTRRRLTKVELIGLLPRVAPALLPPANRLTSSAIQLRGVPVLLRKNFRRTPRGVQRSGSKIDYCVCDDLPPWCAGPPHTGRRAPPSRCRWWTNQPPTCGLRPRPVAAGRRVREWRCSARRPRVSRLQSFARPRARGHQVYVP